MVSDQLLISGQCFGLRQWWEYLLHSIPDIHVSGLRGGNQSTLLTTGKTNTNTAQQKIYFYEFYEFVLCVERAKSSGMNYPCNQKHTVTCTVGNLKRRCIFTDFTENSFVLSFVNTYCNENTSSTVGIHMEIRKTPTMSWDYPYKTLTTWRKESSDSQR